MEVYEAKLPLTIDKEYWDFSQVDGPTPGFLYIQL
jgi:hypothetical protein